MRSGNQGFGKKIKEHCEKNDKGGTKITPNELEGIKETRRDCFQASARKASGGRGEVSSEVCRALGAILEKAAANAAEKTVRIQQDDSGTELKGSLQAGSRQALTQRHELGLKEKKG